MMATYSLWADAEVDAAKGVDLLVAHLVGLPEIVGDDDVAGVGAGGIAGAEGGIYWGFNGHPVSGSCVVQGFVHVQDSTISGLRLVVGGVDVFGTVVAFDDGSALEGAQDLVTAGDDLVAFFDATEDFDVGGSGDACSYGDEEGAELLALGLEEIDALDELRLFGGGGWSVRRDGSGFASVCGQDFFGGEVALDEGLDGMVRMLVLWRW